MERTGHFIGFVMLRLIFILIFYFQCAVRAAVNGHVLVLEGIEKAERNVLPILNNLLENREMQLEDGRFLVAANRYDKLLQVNSRSLAFLLLNLLGNYLNVYYI